MTIPMMSEQRDTSQTSPEHLHSSYRNGLHLIAQNDEIFII